MNRTWILVGNLALLVLCCFLAAQILASVAGEVLVPESAQVAAAPPSGPEPSRSWSDRQVILDRNLFNASTLAPQAELPDEDERYEETKLPLDLLGTVAAGQPELAWAAVLDRETREHQVVKVGDRLKERAEVLRIDRRRIVLENSGRREELSLTEDGAAQPRTASRPAPRRASRVERVSRNRFQMEREDVDSLMANPAALFSQARILPKYEDGQMVGVQLNAIKDGSLFSQIGLQDGDVINQINGIEVTGQQQSAQVLQELTSASEFNVTVTGADGSVRELTADVPQ